MIHERVAGLFEEVEVVVPVRRTRAAIEAHLAGQGKSFCRFDMAADQLGTQRRSPFDDGFVLRGKARSLFIGHQPFLEASCR